VSSKSKQFKKLSIDPLIQFYNKPSVIRVRTNLVWLIVDKIVRVFVGIIVGAWVARYLGPEQLGLLNYAVAFLSVFGALAALGLNGVVVRRLLVYPDSVYATLGAAFTLQFIGGCVAFGLLILAICTIRPDDSIVISMMCVLGFILIFKSSEVIKYWFESRVQSKIFVISEGIVFLLSSITKCLLIVWDASLMTFVWLMLFESALIALFLFYFYWRNGNQVKMWVLDRSVVFLLIKSCWPITISSLLVVIHLNCDKIFLMQYLTLKDVGLYTLASALVAIWFIIPVSIGSSIVPKFTELYVTDKKLYYFYVRKVYIFFSIGTAILAFLAFNFSEIIIDFLYGVKFKESHEILDVMIWAVIFISIVSLRGRFLMIENSTKTLSSLIVLGVLTNVFLILIFVPIYGSIGAAYAFSISWGLNAFIFPFLLKNSRGHALMAIGLRWGDE
jgi:O-antigen/teichoic acid export membrane protein